MTEHGVAGRVVIITGSGQGIGRGMAHHLGKHGASIVVAEWKAHRAERTVAELETLGVPVLGAVCDISRRDQIDDMVARTVERFGRVVGESVVPRPRRDVPSEAARLERPQTFLECFLERAPDRHRLADRLHLGR